MRLRPFRAVDATDSRRVLRGIEQARAGADLEPFADPTFVTEIERPTSAEQRETMAARLRRVRERVA